MSKVLARVTQDIEIPRGPDGKLRVTVPAEWLRNGEAIELELPRNLICAKCDGGGCDLCERSGAVSTRGRKEPAELLQVTLPSRPDAEPAGEGPPSSGQRSVVLRIPEKGGLPEPDDELPRGLLLLAIRPGEQPDACVTKLIPVVPEAELPRPPRVPTVDEERPAPAHSRLVMIVAVIVALWLLALLIARLTGWG